MRVQLLAVAGVYHRAVGHQHGHALALAGRYALGSDVSRTGMAVQQHKVLRGVGMERVERYGAAHGRFVVVVDAAQALRPQSRAGSVGWVVQALGDQVKHPGGTGPHAQGAHKQVLVVEQLGHRHHGW